MSDYFAHWLNMGKKMTNPPKIFHVNWFRRDKEEKFLWPGYGDNLRVLEWILERARGEADAEETAIVYVPKSGSLDLTGLDISDSQMQQLMEIDKDAWLAEIESQNEFFGKFGDDLPSEIKEEQAKLKERLSK